MNQLTDLIERLQAGKTANESDIDLLELLVDHLEFLRFSAIESRYADSYRMQGPPQTDALLRLYERMRGTMPADDEPVLQTRVTYGKREGESAEEYRLRMRVIANHSLDHWRDEYRSEEFKAAHRGPQQPPSDQPPSDQLAI